MLEKKSSLIKFDSISKSFNNKSVLNDIHLEIDAGDSVAIIGESGSGKTTLLKILCGLVQPDSGNVYYKQELIKFNLKDFKKSFGYVTQKASLLPHLTVRKNIELPARIHKNTKNLKQRILDLMSMLQMDPGDLLDKYPYQLSGGQKQRVVIARALINDPDLLIMDEPFSALDSVTKNEIYDQFTEIEEKIKKTIFLVTHDFREAELIADKIIILHNTQIAQIGTFEEIKNNPASDYVKEFIGSQSWRM